MELFLQFSRGLGETMFSYVFLVLFIIGYYICIFDISAAIVNKKRAFMAGTVVVVLYQLFLFSELKLKTNIDNLFF